MGTLIASQLVLGTAADPADPDVVVSRTAHLLHPASRAALAEHIGDLRLTQTTDIAALPVPPLPLLRSAAPVSSEAARVVESATRGWSVILRTGATEAVVAQYAARAAAVLVARDTDGIGIDLAIPRVWPTLDPAIDPDRTADWFVFDRLAADGAGVTTSTKGLSRFGLSELRVTAVDPAAVPAWDAILTGLAHRLVGTESIPERMEIGLGDIAAGYTEPVDPDDPALRRRTTVELADEGDRVLGVRGTAVEDLFAA